MESTRVKLLDRQAELDSKEKALLKRAADVDRQEA